VRLTRLFTSWRTAGVGVRVGGLLMLCVVFLASVGGAAASSWRIEPAPTPLRPIGHLAAVSCISLTDCIAVGWVPLHRDKIQLTLAERWTGASWVVQPTANLAGANGSSLNGVSCISGRSCVAVGSFTTRAHQRRALVER
jgi:hypothetical protein